MTSCQQELPIVDDEAGTGAGSAAATSKVAVSKSLDRTRPTVVLPKPQDFYRIDLARVNGQVSLVAITRIAASIRPLPSLSAEYLLVCFHGDTLVSAVPVRFATSAHDLDFNQVGGHDEFALADTRVSVSVEADAAIDRIELVDTKNQTQLRIAAADLPKAASGGGAGGGTPNAADALRAHFPEIKFVRPSEIGLVAPDLVRGGKPVDISSEYAERLERALSALEPNLRSSIQTLAVVEFLASTNNQLTHKPLRGNTIGPQLVLSSTLGEDVIQTIAHEAAHAFEHATRIAAGNDGNPEEAFRPAWNAFAKQLIDKFHLLYGIADAWEKLHQTGVDRNYAIAYDPNSAIALSLPQALAGGFFSPYGAAYPSEDFAEYVRDRTVGSGNDHPCDEFIGQSGATPERAIPYAKLVLLRGIGAISESSYGDCVGSYSVIPDELGFSFAGRAKRLDENIDAYFKGGETTPTYTVRGAGIGFTMYLNIRRQDINDSPIGLHTFASISLATLNDIPWADYVALIGPKPSDARASNQGVVLVVEATEHTAKGVIFGLGLQNSVGKVTDTWPFVAFNVR
jgi:hypothetical protein